MTDTTNNSHAAAPGAPLRALQGPRWAFVMGRLINPLMRRALAGRLHRIAGSKTLMVIMFAGRRSGKAYSFPIGYMQQGRQVVSYTPFRWWVNLQDGAPVTVVLRGRRRRGAATISTDPAVVAAGMDVYLRHNPGDAMFWKVRLDERKVPNAEDIARVAPENVEIRITLEDDPA